MLATEKKIHCFLIASLMCWLLSGPQRHINDNFKQIPNNSEDIDIPIQLPWLTKVVLLMLVLFVVTLLDINSFILLSGTLPLELGPNVVSICTHEMYLIKFNDHLGPKQIGWQWTMDFETVPIIRRPGLNLNKHRHDKLSIWVKIHDISYDTWNHECLSCIATKISKPLANNSWMNTCVLTSWVNQVLVRFFFRSHLDKNGRRKLVVTCRPRCSLFTLHRLIL